MRFGKVQSRKFGTEYGAYSIVTNREHYDSQITLADHEAEIVVTHFGQQNLHVGNVTSNKALAAKTFFLYPDGKEITLNVVYPKPNKTELRLYISTHAGFKPNGGDIWFLFVQEDKLWLGSMDEFEWRSEASTLKQDESDDVYQSLVNDVNDTDVIRISRLKERDTYVRDRNIALQRMELSGYVCEFDPQHSLFISRFSKKPYLESHHLVPMAIQQEFSQPLDTINNVFCLCPYCHRAVHHAAEPIAREILGNLAEKRPILDNFSLSIPDLFSLYAVEEID
jgi:5-methylcytosine-specific restriction enzyme A